MDGGDGRGGCPGQPLWNAQLAKDAALKAISLSESPNHPRPGPFSHLYEKPLPKYLLSQPKNSVSVWPPPNAPLLQRPGPVARRPPPVPSSALAASLGPNGAISKATPVSILSHFGTFGTEAGQFSAPHGFCLNASDNSIAVADTNNHRIQIFDLFGAWRGEFGMAGREEGMLWYPRKVVINPMRSDEYVVCDRGAERSRMQVFDRHGRFVQKIPIRFVDIVAGLAVDGDGKIVIVDSVSPSVFVVCPDRGELSSWFDISTEMKEPSDLACHGSSYYICDFKGHAVCVFANDGVFQRRICLDAFTSFPNGVDISLDGDILVGDSHGNRLHLTVFSASGNFIAEFDAPHLKVSRACGLRMTTDGRLVTLAKNNHQIIVLDSLSVPDSPTAVAASSSSHMGANHFTMGAASSSSASSSMFQMSPLLAALRRTPKHPHPSFGHGHGLIPSPPDS